MTADDFAKTRDQEKDMKTVATLMIEGIAELINNTKRPFGSSDPCCDILDVLGHRTGDSDADGSGAYAQKLLDRLPDYLREKLLTADKNPVE